MRQQATGTVQNIQKYLTVTIDRPPDDWSERTTQTAFTESLALAHLSRGDAISPDMTWEIAFKRQYVYWLLRARGWSLKRIAQVTHREDHTTTKYGIERFDHICSELGIL